VDALFLVGLDWLAFGLPLFGRSLFTSHLKRKSFKSQAQESTVSIEAEMPLPGESVSALKPERFYSPLTAWDESHLGVTENGKCKRILLCQRSQQARSTAGLPQQLGLPSWKGYSELGTQAGNELLPNLRHLRREEQWSLVQAESS
jgi:hypothetical protein